MIVRQGWAPYRPTRFVGQLWRGVVHTLGLSLALGAFVAGLLVTETEYGHQAIADVVAYIRTLGD